MKNSRKKTKKINKIINFIDDYFDDIEMKTGHKKLKELICEFQNKYVPYKNIQRFAIPIIGCVSPRKSTILNYL